MSSPHPHPEYIDATPEAHTLLWMACGGPDAQRAHLAAQRALKKWSDAPQPQDRERARRLILRVALPTGGRGTMLIPRGTALQRLMDCADLVGVIAGYVGCAGESDAVALVCMGACVGVTAAVRVGLWSGARLSSAAWEGRSAVAWAALGGDVGMVSSLLSRGGRDAGCLRGSVSQCSRVGAVDVVRVLLAAGARLEDACGGKEDTLEAFISSPVPTNASTHELPCISGGCVVGRSSGRERCGQDRRHGVDLAALRV
jgi:hypothetical protein